MNLDSITIKGILNIKELKFCPECGESEFLHTEPIYAGNVELLTLEDEKEIQDGLSLVSCMKCNSSYFVGERATSQVRLEAISEWKDSVIYEKAF